MAMYESLGYCPHNAIHNYEFGSESVSPLWNRTREILGDRTGYMVYTPAGVAYYGTPYVVEFFCSAENTAALELACKLKHLIPVCKYAEEGKKILITDVINPYQIPGLTVSGEEFVAYTGSNLEVFQDAKYVVGLTEEEEAVHLYFFKKEPKKD